MTGLEGGYLDADGESSPKVSGTAVPSICFACGGNTDTEGQLIAERDALLATIAKQGELWALLGGGRYETGRNSDIESERVHAIYEVTGSVNDREFTQVATGHTLLEAVEALAGGSKES